MLDARAFKSPRSLRCRGPTRISWIANVGIVVVGVTPLPRLCLCARKTLAPVVRSRTTGGMGGSFIHTQKSRFSAISTPFLLGFQRVMVILGCLCARLRLRAGIGRFLGLKRGRRWWRGRNHGGTVGALLFPGKEVLAG